MREHKNLEGVIAHFEQVNKEKTQSEKPVKKSADNDGSDEEGKGDAPKKRQGGVHFPEIWPFEEARKLFDKPGVVDGSTVDVRISCALHSRADEVGTAERRGPSRVPMRGEGVQVRATPTTPLTRSEDRVRRGCEKLTKSVGQKQQGRLDGFFTCVA